MSPGLVSADAQDVCAAVNEDRGDGTDGVHSSSDDRSAEGTIKSPLYVEHPLTHPPSTSTHYLRPVLISH